ncbi:unnamed protein product [Caenorhabditis angaria]|uniref:Post-GPI attachment to proteins factor 3 n=1 Tax=Caenorhabditis angaria TaxID=860376 RepID=A0A9P1ISC5_9PELO|nr:unnamed protein product [Caenorhabditis angaria]
MKEALVLAAFLWIFGRLEASNGDRSQIFNECLAYCIQGLAQARAQKNQAEMCPASNSAFGWTQFPCFPCRYNCMWETVELFESQAGFCPQFFGKWPFAAFFGPFGLVIQEPASVIFSLANLLEVWRMLRKLKSRQGILVENREMWIGYTWIGILTWSSSTIFHTWDCSLTEKMDYFSAFAFVLSLFHISLIYMLKIQNPRVKTLLSFGFVAFYFRHIYSMNIKMDYNYNMTLCLTISGLTTLVYLLYLVNRHRVSQRLSHSDFRLIYVLLWAAGAASLEILDFAPIFWIFDSHSLFHLATVPIPSLWWQFLVGRVDFAEKVNLA